MLAVLSIAQLSAQKLKITCEGKEYLLDGNTVVITFNKFKIVGDHARLGDRQEPTLTNISDETLTIDGILTTSNNAYTGVFSWCGFDDQCADVTDGRVEKDGLVLAPGASKNIELHTEVAADAYGSYVANIQLFNDTYEKLGTLSIIYKYNDPTAINDVTVDQQALAVANNTLTYSFANAATRTINLYAVDGKLVKSLSTSAKQGQVQLNDLQQGVYLYTVAQAGKQVATGKALIK